MKTIVQHFIPWFLLVSRLLTGIGFGILCFLDIEFPTNWVVGLFVFGFVGDIFDGILARRWNTDTPIQRKLDSLFDLFFWLGSAGLLFKFFPNQHEAFYFGLSTVMGIVVLEYLTCLVRFRKNPSAHNLLSKLFGILLFLYFLLVFVGVEASIFGYITFIYGSIARLDALLIYLILNKYTHDIPSFIHAKWINQGKKFKKIKLFNS